MEEREKVEKEISLMDIFSILWSKIKLIVIVCLFGCLVGGALGYSQSHDVVYYGTELTYFVSPKKLSDDEDSEVIYGSYLNTIMDSMVRVLSTEKSISEYLSGIEGIPEKPVYTEEMGLETYTQKVNEYNRYVRKVKQSLSFSYKSDGSVYVDANDTESRNFIYVTLSVQEQGEFDKEFTRQLLGQLQVKIPEIVQETMATDKNQYDQTSCTLVTPLFPMVHNMNEGYTVSQTLKYALILGFAALIVVCIVLIIMDSMDKRVKDPEMLETKLNIPLLGVIPTLDFSQEENGGDAE